MFLSVFKLYSKELCIEPENLDETKFKEDDDVTEVFARGMVLFEGDGLGGESSGKSSAHPSAANWKMFCHLFQAYTAYLSTVARKLQSKGRTTVKSLQSILQCSECVHAPSSVDTLTRKLSAQQFRDMYVSHTEYLLSICFEIEAAHPLASKEHSLVSACLHSLQSVVASQPVILSPFLITASKYMRTGAKRDTAKSTSGTVTFAVSAATFVVSLLCPPATTPKAKKEKDKGKSVELIVSAEALPTLVWFLADCGLQAKELQLTQEALQGAWQGMSQWMIKHPAGDASNGWDCLPLVRSVVNVQASAAEDPGPPLEELLNRLNDSELVKAFLIASVEPSRVSTHMQHCELLSYAPILAFQLAIHHINSSKGNKNNKTNENLQLSMDLWQEVHSLLVQKPPAEPKMVALFGMRLTCFTRSISHIVTISIAQLKKDPTNMWMKQAVVPSVFQSALRLLASSVVDARCVPAVLKSLCVLQTLFAHCATDAAQVLCEYLRDLLQSLFDRCAELPEAARMDICNIAHGCSVQLTLIALSNPNGGCLDACVGLLVCALSGAFQAQTYLQRRSFVNKRREGLRLLVRVLLSRPAENKECDDVGCLRRIKESSGELAEELKLCLNQHITLLHDTSECTAESAEWLCARIDAVQEAIYHESDVPLVRHCTTSRLCWNGVLTLSATEVAALTENIRADLRTLDPSSYDTVFFVAAVKKATKNKTSVAEGPPSSEQRRRLGWQFQLWTLLAVWASVSNDNTSNTEHFSAKHSSKDNAIASPFPSQDPLLRGHYLTAAVQALRQLEASLAVAVGKEEQKETDQVDVLMSVNAVVSQGRQLHALLHLAGRLSAQAQLVKTTAFLCQKTDFSIVELTALCNDFRTFGQVTSVMNGVCGKTEESAVIARFSLPAAMNPHQQQVDLFCLTCLALLHSHDCNAQQRYVETIWSNKECHITYQAEKVTIPSSAQEFAALCKQTYRACSLLLQQLQQQQQQQGSNNCFVPLCWDFLPWVCAAASKVLWLAFSDLNGALSWGSFTSASVKSHLSAVSPVEDGKDKNQAVVVSDPVLSRLALLEVQILRAELYEHVGNLDSAFAYLRDATNTAKAFHSSAAQNIVLLHTIRLWHRTASPKLSNLVADLVAGAQEERIYASNVDLSDETSERVRAAVLSVCALFPSVSSGDGDDTTERVPEASSQHLANIRFRHLHRYWDTDAAQQSKLGSEKVSVINCMISPDLKSQLSTYLTETGATLTAPHFSGVRIASAQSSDSALLAALTQSCAFDCVRDLRRRMCLEALRSGGDPLRAFLSGASSCGVAVECWERANAEAQSQDSAESNAAVTTEDGDSGMRGAARLICSALQSDSESESTGAIQGRLQGLMRHCQALHSNGGHEKNGSGAALSFLCFDLASSSLLLGRFDAEGPLVLALPDSPGTQDLPALLTSWDETQERSKTMLRQGLDVEQAGKLTDAQKRSWWSARQNYDSSVENSMCDLQDLLGVWRIMLSCDRAGSAGLFALCEKVLSSSLPDKQEVAKLLPWLKLIANNLASPAEAKGPVSRTMRLSQEEAVTALAQVLADSKIKKTSELAEKIIQQVVKGRSQLTTDCEAQCELSSKPANDAAATPISVVMSATELNSLKVAELRALLKEAGIDAAGKKQDLVNRLHEHYQSQPVSMASSKGSSSTSAAASAESDGADRPRTPLNHNSGNSHGQGHVVLILDEQLQRLPVETMPCLRGANCSRVPSFALLLKLIDDQIRTYKSAVDDIGESLHAMALTSSEPAQPKAAARKGAATKGKKTIAEREETNHVSPTSITTQLTEDLSWQKVSVDKAWYALDIEGNLPLTRSTLQPFLSEYEGKWDWTGIVASIPPEKTTQSLHESSDLFIFCGHGAGERMCDPFRLRRFASCPASLLWGCSSGALKAHGVHDALGTALYYLLAGAPFLVANLWDVTDKDIDKLCMAYMRSVFPSSTGEEPAADEGKERQQQQVPLAEALVQCRGVCRMANAVGSAPVLYGIPTLLVADTST